MKGFRQMLVERQEEIGSIVGMGLDPMLGMLPRQFSTHATDLFRKAKKWMFEVAEEAAPHVCMFKPQTAHWEAIPGGVEAKQEIIMELKERFPSIPVFEDCKRGDIDKTQARYAYAHFELDRADGMNIMPYMSVESAMRPLSVPEYRGKGVVVVCYTSNPPARRFQDQILKGSGLKIWEDVALETLKCAENMGVVSDAGLVMAAAYEYPKGSGSIYSEHLLRGRELVGDKLWYLVPGVGAQGGYVEETIRAGWAGPGSMVICSSSGLTNASQDDDYAEASGKAAEALAGQTSAAIQKAT